MPSIFHFVFMILYRCTILRTSIPVKKNKENVHTEVRKYVKGDVCDNLDPLGSFLAS